MPKSIPPIGFGTWPLKGAECAAAVENALKAGYRLIDTAAMYRNEREVGEGIRRSGVPRDEVFLVTKVWPTDLGEVAFRRSVENSLRLLGTEAVDLLLIHWPNPSMTVAEMMGPLNAALERGDTSRIGVSNFPTRLLAEAVAASGAPIFANECEYHPYLDQTPLLEACRRQGIVFLAYSPLGRRAAFDEPLIQDIAQRLGRSPAQVILRWHLDQDGVVPIPKATSVAHIRQNLDVFGFTLTPEDRAAISALANEDGRQVRLSGYTPKWDE